MIEINFIGVDGGDIRNQMLSYLDAKPVPVPDVPAHSYKSISSSTEDRDHTVTMAQEHPVACTCMWFRFHPLEHWCKHMKEARREALHERT